MWPNLQALGNVRLGQDQSVARNPHDAFIGSAARSYRQMSLPCFSDVQADDREITVCQLKDVRTPAQIL